MAKRPNLINFFYLTASGLVIQLAGTIYRFWLAREIGAVGLGIFQMIYPVYRLISGLAALGLPLALTKWVAEYLATKQHQPILTLQKKAVQLTALISILASLVLYLTAPYLSRQLFYDIRITLSLQIIALAIPFSALSAIYRGYFQGFSAMAPTAVSEITEQISEISFTIIGVTSLFYFLPLALHTYPIIGLTLGEIVCFLTLIAFLRHFRRKLKPSLTENTPLPYAKIRQYTWPILLNQVLASLSLASEGIIIPHFLIKAGCSPETSTALFGKLSGMASPIAYFPLIFLVPLGAVLSPQVSAAYETKTMSQLKPKISLYYLAATVFCFLSFLGILAFARPLAELLYQDTSPALLIRLLTIGLPFTGITLLNINILIAVGATNKILFINCGAIILKTITLMIFIPLLGIIGAAWAFNITGLFIAFTSWMETKPFLRETP